MHRALRRLLPAHAASIIHGRAMSATAAAAPAPPAAAPLPLDVAPFPASSSSSSSSSPPSEDVPLPEPAWFDTEVTVVALRVPRERTDVLVRALSKLMLRLPRVKPVLPDPTDDTARLLLLAQGATPADLSGLSPVQAAAVAAAGGSVLPAYVLRLGYEQLSMEDVLRRLIPPSVAPRKHDLPAAFEVAGHVAHLNLREEFYPWRRAIGRVLLDKNPHIRCVLNKTGAIHATFRTFPAELLAGVDDTRVTLRHCGAVFKFDYREVYWNSRLATEHETMVRRILLPRAVVADVFAGVGPFAVPLALPPARCTVHANDLNPASYAALVANAAANGAGAGLVAYNLDGREFIRRMVATRVPFTEALMNLPADALGFLDVFVGLYRGDAAASGEASGAASSAPPPPNPRPLPLPLPRIHVYCFSKTDGFEEARVDTAGRLLAVLQPGSSWAAAAAAATEVMRLRGGSGVSPPPPSGTMAAAAALLPDLVMRHVRDVSPRKIMVCASFTLPAAVAYAEEAGGVAAAAASAAPGAAEQSAGEAAGGTEPAAKRARVGAE